ncbi:MAG: hypothetical protein WAL75_01965 [Terracidiphilus sp.]
MDRPDGNRLDDLFDQMTTQELESYTQTGVSVAGQTGLSEHYRLGSQKPPFVAPSGASRGKIGGDKPLDPNRGHAHMSLSSLIWAVAELLRGY